MSPKAIIKLLLSIAMVSLVVYWTDLAELKQTLLSIPPWALILVITIYTIGQIISSYKWWKIVQSAGINVTFGLTLRAYFMGVFANCFGLGTIGGDALRGVMVGQRSGRKTFGIATVVADRVHGLAVLALIGTAGNLLFGTEVGFSGFSWLLVALGIGIVAAWFVGPSLACAIFPNNSIGKRIAELTEAFPQHPGTLFQISLLSAIMHLMQIGIHYIMGLALGVEISLTLLISTIPFVNILCALPISWNGLGVRETSYTFFLVPAIIQPEHAVAFGAMWLLAVTISSAVGGVIAILAAAPEDLVYKRNRQQTQFNKAA